MKSKKEVKYLVSAITEPGGEVVGDDCECITPKEAITKWCKLGKKYPTCTSIQPKTPEDGLELLKWVDSNWYEVSALLTRYKCPYKLTWMKEKIEKQLKNNKASMGWNYDEIVPFCMG